MFKLLHMKRLFVACLALSAVSCGWLPHSHVDRGHDVESRVDQGRDAEYPARQQGGKFDGFLAEGYLRLAKQAEFERDYDTVEQFLARGLLARQGALVDPEAISARRLPSFAVGELTDARTWLLQTLRAGAQEVYPWEAARAQTMFDCWMEEQEENFQQSDIDECKRDFYAAMQVINKVERPDDVCLSRQSPVSRCCNTCLPAPSQEAFVLLFEYDQTVFIPQSSGVFEQLVGIIQRQEPAKVLLSGHTDLAGGKVYNRDLSKRRVETVIAMLAARNIHNVSVEGDYYGERSPAVKTPDGQRQLENRRVEVVLQ